MKRSIITMAAVLMGTAWVCQGRTITVDDDGAADFSTIQAAIDDSNDGDTVLVADGTYTGDGNRDIDFHGKAITVISENGPETCIIDCNGTVEEPHRGFYFHSFERQDSVLSGLTVTNGYAVEGGGIYCERGSPSIENCIIARNEAIGAGGISWYVNSSQEAALSRCVIADNRADYVGGIWIDCARFASLTACNSLIAGNTAVYTGGGVGASIWGGVLTFEACTFAGNSAESGGGLSCYEGDFVLRNCILWGNTATIGSQVFSDNRNTMPPFTSVDIYYCDLEGGPGGVYDRSSGWPYGVKFHEGNIDADPCFADPCNGDYHLQSQGGRYEPTEGGWTTDEVTSPCIDAGDSMTPIGSEPFPNGGIINMGAYGGTAEASKSYFGELPCEVIIAGDINGDCRVDFSDFAILGSHWLEWAPVAGDHGVRVTDVKMFRCELIEGRFIAQEEVQKVTVGDAFKICVEVTNFGIKTQNVFNLYGWDLSPENSVELIGEPLLCAAYYDLEPGDAGWLSPFCPGFAFIAKESGWVTMNIYVDDWMGIELLEDTFVFEVLPTK